jgi:hypothetical protein
MKGGGAVRTYSEQLTEAEDWKRKFASVEWGYYSCLSLQISCKNDILVVSL